MRRHANVLGVVLLCAGLFAFPGCGNQDSGDGSDSSQTAVVKAGETDNAAKQGGAAAAKKYLLRYKPTAGQRSTLVMNMEPFGGQAVVPAMTMKLDITIDSTSEDGFTFSFEFTDMTIAGEPLPSEMEGIIGMKGEARCTSRGETLSAKFVLPDDAPEFFVTTLKGMEKQVREMSCPLPEHPVGIGDTWILNQTVSTGMFSIDQTATYTLKECDGERCVLDVKIVQKADPQALNIPALPEGTEATLNRFTGEGTGTLEIGLSRALPVRATMEISSEFSMTIDGSPQDQTSKMRMTLTTE